MNSKPKVSWATSTECPDTSDGFSSQNEDSDFECDIDDLSHGVSHEQDIGVDIDAGSEQDDGVEIDSSREQDNEETWHTETEDSECFLGELPCEPIENNAVGELPCEPTEPIEDNAVSTWTGFKICADNLDKNLRASYQRLHEQTQSLHYFHSYAALDRVNISALSDDRPQAVVVDPSSFLPTDADLQALHQEFQILISRYVNCKHTVVYSILHRVLVQHMEIFAPFKTSVQSHIPSKYQTEMRTKSKL